MRARFAVAAAIVLSLAACAPAPPVVDMKLVPCPPKRVAKPKCVKPPPSGTERKQDDVFANEFGCWRRVQAWDVGFATCAEEAGESP